MAFTSMCKHWWRDTESLCTSGDDGDDVGDDEDDDDSEGGDDDCDGDDPFEEDFSQDCTNTNGEISRR